MIACWSFAGVTLAAVAIAAFAVDLRRAVLALWVAGLSVGAIYLTLGAEVLAIIQWITSSLVAISFVFFSAMFGEFGQSDPIRSNRRWVKIGLGVLVGAAFAWVIWYGAGQQTEVSLGEIVDGTDIEALGKSLTGQNLISLEVLALTLFLVLVGGGVIGRPVSDQDDEGVETVKAEDAP